MRPRTTYRIEFSDGTRRRVGVDPVRHEDRALVALVFLEGEAKGCEARLRTGAGGLWSLEITLPDGRTLGSGSLGIQWMSEPARLTMTACGEVHELVCREASFAELLDRCAEKLGREGREEGLVMSPIPGRVVAISVRPDDRVESGQCLVVIEAMKMENEIPAESRGAVKEILVEVGQTVEAGEGLIRLG